MLDGEQNATFRDHFLEVPFDLSDVLFVTTANTTETIPRPLLDRMEVIELNSYTDEEKLQIAKRHLLPKELKRHGLARTQLKVSDGAIREMIGLLHPGVGSAGAGAQDGHPVPEGRHEAGGGSMQVCFHYRAGPGGIFGSAPLPPGAGGTRASGWA